MSKLFKNIENIVIRSIKKELPSPSVSTWIEGTDDQVKYYAPEMHEEDTNFGTVIKYKIPDEWVKEFNTGLESLRGSVKIDVGYSRSHSQVDRLYSTYLAISLLPDKLQNLLNTSIPLNNRLKRFTINLQEDKSQVELTSKFDPNSYSGLIILPPNFTGEWKYSQEKIVINVGQLLGNAFGVVVGNSNDKNLLNYLQGLLPEINRETFKTDDPIAHLFKFYLLTVFQAAKMAGEDFRAGRTLSEEEKEESLKTFVKALTDAGAKRTGLLFGNILYMTKVLDHGNDKDSEANIQAVWDEKKDKQDLKRLSAELSGLVKLHNDGDTAVQKELVKTLRLLPKALVDDLKGKFEVITDEQNHRGHLLPTKEKVYKDHSTYNVNTKSELNTDELFTAIGRSIYNYIYHGLLNHAEMSANNGWTGIPIETALRKFIYNNRENSYIRDLRAEDAPEVEYYKFTKPAELTTYPEARLFRPGVLLATVFKDIMNQIKDRAEGAGEFGDHERHKVFEDTLTSLDSKLSGSKDLFDEILGRYFKV